MRTAALLSIAALSLLGATAATAAPATTTPTPCGVVIPGVGTAEGVGRLVATSSGNVTSTCQAVLTEYEGKTQRIPGDACTTLVTASGRVILICHSK